MIVVLLSCSTSYCQMISDANSSTGEVSAIDTAKVIVPVNAIKKANAKLIERNYLIKINNEKDSIIILNKNYIKEQSIIINDFQNRLATSNEINERIKKDLERQRKKTKIIGGVAGGAIIAVIVGLIAK